MIAFRDVSKTYPGADGPAVSGLSLEVPTGLVCVLLGPSGCGKSTLLRMVNRLVEPDTGSVELDGRDVRSWPIVELRRGIGYAIQGVGLFPHWTVAENIGCVPGLLGWPPERVGRRVQELLDLVGLEPRRYGSAYPDELSGGEAQRVGVARALAADPPVMLMDEPFGAVDPLTRDRLQSEFGSIQRELRKTVLFVTHDLDEAIRVGDRVALLREGRLVQYDAPAGVLARPVDAFAADFVGSERVLRLLALVPVTAALEPVRGAPRAEPGGESSCGEVDSAGALAADESLGAAPVDGPGGQEPASGGAHAVTISSDASLRDALVRMLSSDRDSLLVLDAAGRSLGNVELSAIPRHLRREGS